MTVLLIPGLCPELFCSASDKGGIKNVEYRRA